VSEQERVARGSQIIDGYGDDSTFDRLQEWYHNLPADSRKKIDDEFVSNVWRVLDSAGNLLISKHHDYGPKNIAHSPGGPLNGLRVRLFDKMARINNLLDNKVSPSHESLRDSFIDMLNYAAIAILVLDGRWPEVDE
jgi:hypothetical protein